MITLRAHAYTPCMREKSRWLVTMHVVSGVYVWAAKSVCSPARGPWVGKGGLDAQVLPLGMCKGFFEVPVSYSLPLTSQNRSSFSCSHVLLPYTVLVVSRCQPLPIFVVWERVWLTATGAPVLAAFHSYRVQQYADMMWYDRIASKCHFIAKYVMSHYIHWYRLQYCSQHYFS